jgi:hypothetical protein
MVSFSFFLDGMKDRPALLAFILTTALILSLCLAFDPCWSTNDDVAMSMIAHGYGLASYGSPNLVFSNVVWGYVVRTIPSINGVIGYSLATMAVLLVFGWATMYFLIRLGLGYLIGLLAVALLIAQPTLIVQFTVNAGLLTVAAVIGWQVYARLGGVGTLVVACLLAFVGYLIRSQEFLLVLGVALPFLPWRALRERRQMQIAFLLLGLAIAAAAAFDRWSYSGPEWQQFLQFNSTRIPFTDYGVGEHLKQHPEILARHGNSQNDIDLVGGWFSIDPKVATPESLKAMQAELGPLPMQEGSVQSGFTAIQALFDPMLLTLFLSALFLFVLMPRWPVALGWMFCLAALFAMGVMGRPGIMRVYVPLISLLLLAPLVIGKYREGTRRRLATLTLLIACIGNAYWLIPTSLVYKQWTRQAQKDIRGLSTGLFVSWADDFPFELAFPLLANDLHARNIRFYALDSFTHAPFSVAYAEQTAGGGMLGRLKTKTGIPLIASPKRIELLRIYCKEHLNGQLQGAIMYQTSWITVHQVRCEAGE